MKSVAAPIAFANSRLCEAPHVCAFFRSEEEGYRVLLPFHEVHKGGHFAACEHSELFAADFRAEFQPLRAAP